MAKNNLRETLERAEAPSAENSSKPDSPAKMKWGYVLKRAFSEFSQDGCTDLAAAMTYFSVSAVFPGLLAVVSLLGVFGQGEQTTQAITGFLEGRVPPELNELLSGPINNLTSSTGGGIIALLIGVATGLWTASGYVGALSRSMNRIYEVEEGRGFVKLKGTMLLVTLVVVVTVVLIFLMILLSGGIAETVGNAIGLGSTAVTVWNIAKWPVILVLLMLMMAVLYYAAPNVKQPKFRWVSPGAIFAILGAILAAGAFSIYATQFATQTATYGVIGGVILGLLGVWIINNVILLGAEIDAEVERTRELQAGLPAEDMLQLPPRDVGTIVSRMEKEEKLMDQGRQMRLDSSSGLDYSEAGKDSEEGTAEVANFDDDAKEMLEQHRRRDV